MRLFIAVGLEDGLKNRVNGIREGLAKSGADVKWVEPANLHFTLKFLGETGEEKIGGIASALKSSLEGVEAFDISVEGAGVFPGPGNPRVVWLGVGRNGDRMRGLAQTVELALAPLGFERSERVFSPHLTLGRVRSPRGKEALAAAVGAAGASSAGVMRVGEVLLMKSRLSPEGALHSRVETYKLCE